MEKFSLLLVTVWPALPAEQILKHHPSSVSRSSGRTHVNYNRILLSSCWQRERGRKTITSILEWYQQNNVDCAGEFASSM